MTNTPHLKVWDEKYATERPRRMLALDGGGILGVISLEILAEIEHQLAEKSGKGNDFKLGEHFDYIAGTSTGAIIATALAIGMRVSEIRDLYERHGRDMFSSRWLIRRARAFYDADPLKRMLQDVLGDRTLGAEDLRCLLMIVTRNTTTDSPWPLSNNPFAKYNDRGHPQCNLDIPLWRLVRASTAAPVYFPPQTLSFSHGRKYVFVDGGVTPYNNPAFLLYRMATAAPYRLCWPTGEEKLMLISVGTGRAALIDRDLSDTGRLITRNLQKLPSVLMSGVAAEQDINCRMIGRCVFGHVIDREIGDLIPRVSATKNAPPVPLETDLGREFLYARYDPEVGPGGLADLGLPHLDPGHVQALDGVKYMQEMQQVGRAYAQNYVDLSPLNGF